MHYLRAVAFNASLLVLPQAASAGVSPGNAPAGTYDILVCNGTCSFDRPEHVLVKGSIVLFKDKLEQADLQRFDENRLNHHFGEPINGCFTLETVSQSSIYAGVEKVGITSWSAQGGRYRFSLFHSPDAGYEVTVERSKNGLIGTGSSWGAGAGAPQQPSTETVIALRTGDASLANCTFQTAEEHEFRRLLADPARSEMAAIESAYRSKLLAGLELSPAPRDWAMAGWLQNSEQGEAQILRAREIAPKDPLVQWMAVVRTHASEVPVTLDGAGSAITLQWKELDSVALAELQRTEPQNAIWWLMALRNAVDRNDPGASDAALVRLAASTVYDDHAAEFLKAQLELFRTHPLPPEYFAAVARLDPGWRLNGEFTTASAPYYQNQYPFAVIGVNSLFFMTVQSGMHELYAACVQQPVRSAARAAACVTAARLLAAHANRAEMRDGGSRLLGELNDFTDEDIARARSQAWIASQYREIHPRLKDPLRPFVQEEIAFVVDWLESSDEFEAMRRAVKRAGKPLEPPEDFQLNPALYGNFIKRTRKTPRAG